MTIVEVTARNKGEALLALEMATKQIQEQYVDESWEADVLKVCTSVEGNDE